jgi:hypothetical protein
MSDAWRSSKIREFEQVSVSPSIALLRLAAKTTRRRPAGAPPPTLVADDGQTISHFAAIPASHDGRGVLHAAYPVPAQLLTAGTTFSLELADGQVMELPEPQPGPARTARRRGAGAAVTRGPDGKERRTGPQAKLATLSGELGEARHERPGEGEASDARAAAELAELQTWSGELERRMADTTTELATAKATVEADATELERLRGLLAESEARVEMTQAEIVGLGERLRAAHVEIVRRAAESEARDRALGDLAQAGANGLG